VRAAYDEAYDEARVQHRSCNEAEAGGLVAARCLYVQRTGLDDELTDACVQAMV
jgi:hypothetical protein